MPRHLISVFRRLCHLCQLYTDQLYTDGLWRGRHPRTHLLAPPEMIEGGGGRPCVIPEDHIREEHGAVHPPLPVERAHRVNGGASGGEYGRHARELDAEHSAVGTPIADRLASFTQVRALVFGTYAEGSHDVHTLIDLAARALARKNWRGMGARNEQEARSWWVARCRRRIGTAVARAHGLRVRGGRDYDIPH